MHCTSTFWFDKKKPFERFEPKVVWSRPADTHVGPLARYEREIDSGQLNPDDEQRAVVRLLDSMASGLAKRKPWKPPSTGLLSRFFAKRAPANSSVEGLYLWGGVGRGKTHLCDLFYEQLEFEDKTRLHFHRFMQRIHNDLRELGQVENPIPLVADKWAARTRLLLLDEIHVNDITDAMLLGSLLTELFARGVTLVTTSNLHPDDLYKDGLQRSRFLPAIEQIKQHTHVLEMVGDTDYRLRLLQREAIYIVCDFNDGCVDEKTAKAMQKHFDRLAVGKKASAKSMQINGRELPLIARSSDVIWLDFDELCNTPRSTNDYIELATTFHTVLLSNVPILDENRNDAARRLVNLVDEFYDRHVKLVISAEAMPDELYTGKRLEFEFVRAASRLMEMQTTEYLSAERHPLTNS